MTTVVEVRPGEVAEGGGGGREGVSEMEGVGRERWWPGEAEVWETCGRSVFVQSCVFH